MNATTNDSPFLPMKILIFFFSNIISHVNYDFITIFLLQNFLSKELELRDQGERICNRRLHIFQDDCEFHRYNNIRSEHYLNSISDPDSLGVKFKSQIYYFSSLYILSSIDFGHFLYRIKLKKTKIESFL